KANEVPEARQRNQSIEKATASSAPGANDARGNTRAPAGPSAAARPAPAPGQQEAEALRNQNHAVRPTSGSQDSQNLSRRGMQNAPTNEPASQPGPLAANGVPPPRPAGQPVAQAAAQAV